MDVRSTPGKCYEAFTLKGTVSDATNFQVFLQITIKVKKIYIYFFFILVEIKI